jgi:hypothetical protein
MILGKVTWLVLISITFNLAAAFVAMAIVSPSGTPIFDATAQSNYAFDKTEAQATSFTTELEETIKPAGSIEDKGDQIYRVMDVMSLGFLYKFYDSIDTYIYGSINIIDNVFGQYLDAEVRTTLFGNENNEDLIPNKLGTLKLLISILYIFAGFQLFTGTEMTENL